MSPNSRTFSFTSFTSSGSASSAEQIRELKDQLESFYRLYDPRKLEDETKVNELIIWARKYSLQALQVLMRKKYGVEFAEVACGEEAWSQVKTDLTSYYRKYDNSKTNGDIEKIYLWSKQNGLAKLNERLVSKYGVPLHAVKTHGASGWASRWGHVIANQNLGNISDQLHAFYAKFDPSKTEEEIEKLVSHAHNIGIDAVNELLEEKYGATLDDVELIGGSSHDEREYNLRSEMETFQNNFLEEKMTTAQFDALVKWGLVSFKEMNAHLLRTHGYNLDSKKVDPEALRHELFDFFSKHDPTNRQGRARGELESLVKFAVAEGREALIQKLLHTYGQTLPSEEIDRSDAEHFAQQTPKMSRFSVARKSLTNAVRKSLGRKSFSLTQ